MSELCKHCGGEIAIRNPKGVCDHLYYPENCNVCSGEQTPDLSPEDIAEVILPKTSPITVISNSGTRKLIAKAIQAERKKAEKEISELKWELEKTKALEFWKDIVIKDGELDIEQVKKELTDFHYIMEQYPKVLCHITNGALSKLMYPADVICNLADECYEKLYKEDA